MSLRFRRSLRIAPGVRVNLTKTGWGVTVGPRGAHVSVHSTGRRTTTVGLPGTGLSFQSTTSRRSRARESVAEPALPVPGASAGSGAPADPERLVPGAGFFAPHAEKSYRNGVIAYLRRELRTCVDAMTICLAEEPEIVSARLFAGMAADALDEDELAITHLEAVLKSDHPLPDRFEAKYLPQEVFALAVTVPVTDAITAHAPFSELGATLALAQLYRDGGRLEEAIGLMQQLDEAAPDPLVRLSLADLLLADRDYDGVVELSTGVANESDLDVELLHLRASAFLAQGLPTAAQEAFRDALRKATGRDPALLHAVRYDRALAYEQQGQVARARAEYERLYAADPTDADVRERLAATQETPPRR